MRPQKAVYALFVLILIAIASGAPDEASGIVVLVVDGDTFDVNILEHDGRIQEETIRVRLADLDAPELYGERACREGEWARDYTRSWLMDSPVSMDIDDVNGQDEYGRWIAVCYLKDGRNFNKMLVDSGNAARKDFRSNEFDPYAWRDIRIDEVAVRKTSNVDDREADLNAASGDATENASSSLPESVPADDEASVSSFWRLLADLLQLIFPPNMA